MITITLDAIHEMVKETQNSDFVTTSHFFEQLYANQCIPLTQAHSDSKKILFLITGGIGAGKSTLAYKFVNYFELFELPFISTDLLYSVHFKNKSEFERDYNNARNMTDERLLTLQTANCSFVWETVLSKEKKRCYIETLQKHGYEVVCLFIMADPQVCIKRSNDRTNQGNHFVPADFILDRHHKTVLSYEWMKKIADTMILFDNSEQIRLVHYKSKDQAYTSSSIPEYLIDII